MPAIRFIQLILLLALLTTYCLAAPKNAGSKMDKQSISLGKDKANSFLNRERRASAGCTTCSQSQECRNECLEEINKPLQPVPAPVGK